MREKPEKRSDKDCTEIYILYSLFLTKKVLDNRMVK